MQTMGFDVRTQAMHANSVQADRGSRPHITLSSHLVHKVGAHSWAKDIFIRSRPSHNTTPCASLCTDIRCKVALEFSLWLEQDRSREATLPHSNRTSSFDRFLLSQVRQLLTRLHLETTRPSATTGTLELPALALDVRLL